MSDFWLTIVTSVIVSAVGGAVITLAINAFSTLARALRHRKLVAKHPSSGKGTAP